jgi:putative Mg2+ transporter-C (MgtC) family protein
MENWHADAGILFSLLIAMLLSGVIGWDRGHRGHSAGMRTSMLVGLSAALFTQTGDLLIQHFDHYGQAVRGDPIRVLQSIVLGVSFLGSGIIFVAHNRDEVRGLTTAASVWTITGVGIVVGLHRYLLATAITVMILIVLEVLRIVEVRAGEKTKQQ